MTRSSSRYAIWVLTLALLYLPAAGFVTPSSAEEQTTKEKIDKGVQETGKAIQKVMEPVEKAISEGAGKAAETVKKAVKSDKSDKSETSDKDKSDKK